MAGIGESRVGGQAGRHNLSREDDILRQAQQSNVVGDPVHNGNKNKNKKIKVYEINKVLTRCCRNPVG